LFFFSGDFCVAGLEAGAAVGFLPASLVAAGDAAGEGTPAGATEAEGTGDGKGNEPDWSTERDPFTPGNESVNAININAAAAPIVILAKRFAVPRGPKAVLETLLVNNAPASAFPGCSRITIINTAQARINSPYKI